MLYPIHRWRTNSIHTLKFTAEIDCSEDTPDNVKRGLAIQWAIKNRADLTGANLLGANLVGAYLMGANFAGANLDDACLVGANLARACLVGARLVNANLADANLADANLASVCLNNANLDSVNLDGVSLIDVSLINANLARTRLIDGGQRSDGHRFIGWANSSDVLWVRAGCYNFSIADARTSSTTLGLGEETGAILDHIERVAKIRKLI